MSDRGRCLRKGHTQRGLEGSLGKKRVCAKVLGQETARDKDPPVKISQSTLWVWFQAH
jgi:hypothetical protein